MKRRTSPHKYQTLTNELESFCCHVGGLSRSVVNGGDKGVVSSSYLYSEVTSSLMWIPGKSQSSYRAGEDSSTMQHPVNYSPDKVNHSGVSTGAWSRDRLHVGCVFQCEFQCEFRVGRDTTGRRDDPLPGPRRDPHVPLERWMEVGASHQSRPSSVRA